MGQKTVFTLPNLLSFYRLIVFPLILYFALTNKEKAFIILLVLNLVSDVLDGFLARKLNLQSEFGARLDSIADIGTFILAVIGIFQFKLNDFQPHLISFLIFLSFYLSTIIFSLIKFKKFPCLHLYSWKIGGYIQGLFIAVLFLFDFFSVFYYFMIIWGILSYIEHLIIQIVLKEMIPNQKGLYWLLDARN